MKRVVHVSFSDESGGAAIAAYRLHTAMIQYGIDSHMVVFDANRTDDNVKPIYNSKFESFYYKIKSYIIADRGFVKTEKNGFFSKYNIGSNIKNNKIIMNSDVVFIHWICRGMMNINNIKFLLEKGKQVFWVMHDMYPFTGGCHHSYGCTNYEHSCKNCPCDQINVSIPSRNLKKKIILKKYDNMHWIAPSNWLYECARNASVINSANLYRLPNIISENFFKLDKSFSRKVLGLSMNKKYILYGADGVLTNPYKGLDLFIEMLNKLKQFSETLEDSVEVNVFGSGKNDELMQKIPFKINFFGNVRDEHAMNIIYNSSDVFVSTSRVENLPLTIQEASFCGLPVVAFNVGGISDLVDSDSKGALIEGFNTENMSKNVFEILTKGLHTQTPPDNSVFRNSVIKEYIKLLEDE